MTIIHPVALSVPAADQALAGRTKVRALSKRARQALERSAGFGGLNLGALEKNPDGVPLPSNGIYWSVTHKETWVAAVAAPFAVGIDLETIRPVTPRLYQRAADEAEWAVMGKPDLERFFRVWTAKEAVLKAEGKGIAGLGHCKIDTIVNHDTLRMVYAGTMWTVTHHRFAEKQLMAVTAKPSEIAWHILSEKQC